MDTRTAALLALTAVLGLLCGTWLDGCTERLVTGGPVRGGLRPRCRRCDAPLTGSRMLPLVWRSGGAACPGCGEALGRTRWVLELATACVAVAVTWSLWGSWALPAYLVLAAALLVLAAVDLRTKRLPNALTLPLYPVFGALLLLAAVLDDQLGGWIRAVLGGMALFALYLLLALLNPAGMGLGDVKLAGVVGMALAWFGWPVWVAGAVSAFLLAAAVGIVLLATRRADRRTPIPFGPFMVLGALGGIVFAPTILTWSTTAPFP